MFLHVWYVLGSVQFWSAWLVCVASWVPFGTPRPPSPTTRYTLPRFILKDPGLQPLRNPPETRGHPGCNNKSKNYPRAHKRRIKPPQALSFRYPRDSVSRSHQTLYHPLHPQCTNHLFWLKTPLSSLSIISLPPNIFKTQPYFVWWVPLSSLCQEDPLGYPFSQETPRQDRRAEIPIHRTNCRMEEIGHRKVKQISPSRSPWPNEDQEQTLASRDKKSWTSSIYLPPRPHDQMKTRSVDLCHQRQWRPLFPKRRPKNRWRTKTWRRGA
jgi:hypothetical protein